MKYSKGKHNYKIRIYELPSHSSSSPERQIIYDVFEYMYLYRMFRIIHELMNIITHENVVRKCRFPHCFILLSYCEALSISMYDIHHQHTAVKLSACRRRALSFCLTHLNAGHDKPPSHPNTMGPTNHQPTTQTQANKQ